MKLVRVDLEKDILDIVRNQKELLPHWHRFYTGFLRGTNSVAVIQKHIIHSLNRKDNET